MVKCANDSYYQRFFAFLALMVLSIKNSSVFAAFSNLQLTIILIGFILSLMLKNCEFNDVCLQL